MDAVRALIAPYVDLGRPVSFVELSAGLDIRLDRNRGADRVAEKRSKRDLDWSDAHVREMEALRMNTDPAVPSPADAVLSAHPHLRLDTTDLTPAEAATAILAWRATHGHN